MKNRIWTFIRNDLLTIALDIIAVNLAYYGALIVRFSAVLRFREIVTYYMESFLKYAPVYTILCIVIFSVFRLYGGMWRYAGISDLNRIIGANIVTSVVMVAGTLLFIKRMPITYYAIGFLFQLLMIVIIRFEYRIVFIERRKYTEKQEDVIIVGSGEEAHYLHRLLDSGIMYRPICYVDKDNHGRTIDGLHVYKSLEGAAEDYAVRWVFLADLNLTNEDKERIRGYCKAKEIQIKDYSSFFNYSEESDDYSGMREAVRGPRSGEHSIPFSPPDIGNNEIDAVVETLYSGWITTGPRTKLLERRLAAYIETGDANADTETEIQRWQGRVVCLNSATASEELNLRILGIREGDEVIVPAYTYTASASAAVHCGARIVFVDIQKDGDRESSAPEMDYEKLEQAITPATKAIITVDLGGTVCDYDRVFDIAERKKELFTPLESDGTPLGDLSSRIQNSIGRIAVVADCAHSLGASRKVGGVRKYCGAIADFSSFSFHAVKNFTTAEGGASTWRKVEGVDDKEIYRFFQLLSLHGQSKDALAKTRAGAWEYDVIGPWYKYNMTDIMAAIGLRQLDRYPALLDRRSDIIRKYDRTCDELGLSHLFHYTKNMNSSNHLYLVRVPGISVEKRNEIMEKMASRGVATNVHYKPLPMMTAYKALGADIKDFPNAYAYYENLFTLPLHTLLTDEDVDYVCESLKNVITDLVK